MSRSLWLADVVRDTFRGVRGVQVDEIPGWETRGRPVANHQGVIDHHTGRGSYNALLNYMAYGSSIAPLCNIATSRPWNGIVRVTIVSSGKANHAGRGQLWWTGHDNGNAAAIGIEHQNDGSQSWPAQQVEVMKRLDKALLDHMGLGTDRLADHKTYAPGRKVDRHSIHIPTYRSQVDQVVLWDKEEQYMGERYYEQAVIGHSAVDIEMGRVLANYYGLALVQVDGRGHMNSVSHPGNTAKVGYGLVIGAAGGKVRGLPIGAMTLAGENRDGTAEQVGRFLATHDKSKMNRRGVPWR